jgi:hypothetical protein
MANYGWNIVPGRVRMPKNVAGETVNGTPFSVPGSALVMQLQIPVLASSATVKLQSLVVPLDDQVADVWQDVSTFNLAGGTAIALSGIPSNATTTIPITATGAGVLRLVASADQSGAPVDITVAFMCL